MEETTKEQIDRHYSACMDSVNLIVRLQAKINKSELDIDTIQRNVEHLKIMLKKDFWDTDHDLSVIEAVI